MENCNENYELAKILMPQDLIVKAKCYYDPDDGSIDILATKDGYGSDSFFYYPCFLRDGSVKGITEFYDEYLCTGSFSNRIHYLKNVLEYENYHPYAYSPVENYIKNIDQHISENVLDINDFWTFYNIKNAKSLKGLVYYPISPILKIQALIEYLKNQNI